ncbi:MAG: Cna B-type domain-containing protein [Lachnospiraceae bacterium]|nr:Cna B-type domain-containing protein [Lachnospiraceae bacterium]
MALLLSIVMAAGSVLCPAISLPVLAEAENTAEATVAEAPAEEAPAAEVKPQEEKSAEPTPATATPEAAAPEATAAPETAASGDVTVPTTVDQVAAEEQVGAEEPAAAEEPIEENLSAEEQASVEVQPSAEVQPASEEQPPVVIEAETEAETEAEAATEAIEAEAAKATKAAAPEPAPAQPAQQKAKTKPAATNESKAPAALTSSAKAAPAASSSTTEEVADFEALRTLIQNDADARTSGLRSTDAVLTLKLTADITGANTPVTIVDGQKIVLSGNKVIEATSSQKLFYITNGGQLTLTEATLKKAGVEVGAGGTFIMESGKITGNTSASGSEDGVAVNVSGTGATFHFKGGEISGNSGYSRPTIAVSNNGVMNMSGGEVKNNQSNAAEGTILVGSDTAVGMSKTTNGTLNMTGGTIDNNRAGLGGAIGVYGRGELNMTAGTITNNYASQGGAIAVYSYSNNARVTIGEENPDTVFEEGKYPHFEGNKSSRDVGALYIGTNKATIHKAKFINNHTDGQGGAIYVGTAKDRLLLNNVLIRNNTAELTDRSYVYGNVASNRFAIGGGFWACPTGSTQININGGWAVYDNRATGESGKAAGDDIFVADPYYGYTTTLTERMLGGGVIEYYEDGGSVYDIWRGANYHYGLPGYTVRYVDAEDPVRFDYVTDYRRGLAVHSVTSAESIRLAESLATVILEGNTATRGGGIATNGKVVIGDREYREYELTVNKEWIAATKDADKKPVEVQLLIDGIVIETVTLSADNDWTHTFTGLPNPTYDENGVSNFRIVEVVPDGYRLVQQITKESTSGNVIVTEVTITNRKEADKIEEKLGAKKTLSGKTLEDKEFTFELLDKNGNVIRTARNNAAGEISFGAIAFTENDIGVHTFRIREKATGKDGITYDTKVYDVRITVSYEEGTNTLQAVVEYLNSKGEPEFRNTFKPDNPPGDNPPPENPPGENPPPENPPEEPPADEPEVLGATRIPAVLGAVRGAVLGGSRAPLTGDESRMLLWGAVLVFAILLGAVWVFRSRKA